MILRLVTGATLIFALIATSPDVSQAVAKLQRVSAQEELTDHETPTPHPTPLDVPPPGERNPYVALVAALAIVVVGITGIFIYRMIREGL